MCGLVYAHNIGKTPVNNDVLQQFDRQRNRGLQGFGLFDGQENHIVREVKEDNILKWLVKYESNLILFHHRMPTSTDNVKRAAHPFATKKYFGKNQYILIHNGHISNSFELKREHEKLGIEYQSIVDKHHFNDSEALLWDFALTMEGKQPELKAKGGIAFICIKLTKGKLKTLFFGRNNNPLFLNITDDGVRLASEGDGESILSHYLYQYDYKKNHLSKKEFDIPTGWESYSGYTPTPYTRVPLEPAASKGWNWENDKLNRKFARKYSKENRPGNWLPDSTRNAVGKKFGHIGDDPVIDYDRDGNPLFASDMEFDTYDDYIRAKNRLALPANASVEGKTVQEWSMDNDTEEMVDLTKLHAEWDHYDIDIQEVESKSIEYIMAASGNFDTAYQNAEADYMVLEDLAWSEGRIRGGVLLEGVLEYIANEEEFVNEDSVSSYWLALCEQQAVTKGISVAKRQLALV